MKDRSVTRDGSPFVRLGPVLVFVALSTMMIACNTGGSSGGLAALDDVSIQEVSNGFGRLSPLEIGVGGQLIAAPVPWPIEAKLPDGTPGNHFLRVTFSGPVSKSSIIDDDPILRPKGFLTGAITITDASGQIVKGVAMHNGKGFRLDEATGQIVENVFAERLPDGTVNAVPGFPAEAQNLGDNVFLFIADSDGDLGTLETFPIGQVSINVFQTVRSITGEPIATEGCTGVSVGPDIYPPRVIAISPANNSNNVDIFSDLFVTFSEPILPGLGPQSGIPPSDPATATLNIGPLVLPVNADSLSPHNLCTWRIQPIIPLPGLSDVSYNVFQPEDTQGAAVEDLFANLLTERASVTFRTATGPALVNAPVSPEAIYWGSIGGNPGMGVIDLNGGGATTGAPTPDNPSGINIGSNGVDSLVLDSSGSPFLQRPPIIGAVSDIHVGNFIDGFTFMGVPQFDQTNPNAATGFHVSAVCGFGVTTNTISDPPTPNPPALSTPPTSLSNPFIPGAEPVPCTVGGPGPAPATTIPCSYSSRQQIGNLLYVVDKNARAIQVVNSNLFTIYESIATPDPEQLAFAPNLKLLYVSNFSTSDISIVDTRMSSSTIHTELSRVPVGRGPRGIAVQPDNEDVFVCNFLENTVSIINVNDQTVRKTLASLINRPYDVVLSSRQSIFGYFSGVYFGYISNAGGNSVTLFESGPAAPNGVGPDDVLGEVTGFFGASKLQLDPHDLRSGVFVCHTDSRGLGRVSRLTLTNSPQGIIPFPPTPGFFNSTPGFRTREWTVLQTYETAGPPADIAFDNLTNVGCLFGGGNVGPSNAVSNSKDEKRFVPGGAIPVNTPTKVYIASYDRGVVEIFDQEFADKIGEVVTPGVTVLADYWEQ